ncbi:MAG: Creatinine amidohydrolase [Lentisphaerae bacterium ADurb.Bin242]|nr:MAG: Creatinine amidohydrolase [Lentisphaerae bacterium ADurb.Bin242]
MHYLNMRPEQIRDAIQRNLPAVLPLGVVEYHAEHLPVGVDSHVVNGMLERIEAEAPDRIILLPPFCYGSATFAVAGPEGNGTIDVKQEHLVPVAEDIFRSLLRVGFRNIFCFIAHQTERFYQGMPTDLAFRSAAIKVIFERLEQENGEGWWGKEKNSSYYSGKNNPFHWIRVFPVRTTEETKKKFKGDHAGVLETSEMLAMHPEQVDMSKIDDSLWFARSAREATCEFGEAAIAATISDMRRILLEGADII